MRPPLAEQLISQAAVAKLIVQCHRVMNDLFIVFAVPPQSVVASTATLETLMERSGQLLFTLNFCQFFRRTQSRQPEGTNIPIRPIKLNVVSVRLLALQHAIIVVIPVVND